ncbi:MAG: peptidase MA family metallohydrolase [Chloroflexi bacterium]|nr:peptidase MA family metallohydrolase [Chloroflexota bacterium]
MKKILPLLIILFFLNPQVVFARAKGFLASSNTAVITFPDKILFKVDLQSDTEIVDVKLLYGTLQDTCGEVTAIAFPEFSPSSNVHAEWGWDMRQSGGEPPGTTIWWQWQGTDQEGRSLTTERKEIIWLDSVHPWVMIEDGMIRLHYYEGGKVFGEILAGAAVSALDRLSGDTGILPDQPIDLYIYGDTNSLRDAILYEPGWTGGLAYAEHNIVVIGISPQEVEWGKRTEAHELTHVLVGDFTFSCLGAMPTWLVEGLAVYGEGGPESSGKDNFEEGKASNTLFSFQVLSGGFSEDPNQADLSYSQSFYMVNYLIDLYGKDKLIHFLETLKSGGELSSSLHSTYGFDLNEFEVEWRTSFGLPPSGAGKIEMTATPTIVPTIVPINGVSSKPILTSQPGSVLETPSAAVLPNLQKILGKNNLKIIAGLAIGCICVVGILLLVLGIVFLKRKKKNQDRKGNLQ